MNIYRISQDTVTGYDTFDSAVVVAPDVDTARNIHPASGHGSGSWTDEHWGDCSDSWANSPDSVKVELIGRAFGGQRRGVIVASYNMG